MGSQAYSVCFKIKVCNGPTVQMITTLTCGQLDEAVVSVDFSKEQLTDLWMRYGLCDTQVGVDGLKRELARCGLPDTTHHTPLLLDGVAGMSMLHCLRMYFRDTPLVEVALLRAYGQVPTHGAYCISILLPVLDQDRPVGQGFLGLFDTEHLFYVYRSREHLHEILAKHRRSFANPADIEEIEGLARNTLLPKTSSTQLMCVAGGIGGLLALALQYGTLVVEMKHRNDPEKLVN